MNDRLRWWVLPGAMLVLLGVLTLGEPDAAGDVAAVEASDGSGTTAVVGASGRRLGELPLPVGGAGAFVVTLPVGQARARGTMRLWRRLATGREAQPWLQFRGRVRGDGTIPIAGLAVGDYDVELQLDGAVLWAGAGSAPGTVPLRPAAAAPR